MDDADDHQLVNADSDVNELLGLYDAPAFSRRGQDVEFALKRLHERCAGEREARIDMVRMRLRQWGSLAAGPDAALDLFHGPIDPLWPLCGVEPPPRWGTAFATPRRLRTSARDLVASVERFNRRWSLYVSELKVDTLNRMIEGYNRYYLLEKECSLGSSRLAARFFVAHEEVTPDRLLARYPLLPEPALKSPAARRSGLPFRRGRE